MPLVSKHTETKLYVSAKTIHNSIYGVLNSTWVVTWCVSILTTLHETPCYLNRKLLPLLNYAFSISTWPCRLCRDIFIYFHHRHLDRILSLGGRWEKKGRGGKKINKGKMDDRRQKVEEGDTSKWRSFCGSWGEMRKKVSLHQTHELPLLQTVPAQGLDETRYLTLNWSPTALLGECGCVCVCVCMFLCSKVLGQ